MYFIMIFATLFTFSGDQKQHTTHYLKKWLGGSDGVMVFNYQTGKILYQYNPKNFKKSFTGGSIFKLVSTLYLLREYREMSITQNCTGIKTYGSKIGRCWKRKGHGVINLHQALIHSCNHFFYESYNLIDRTEWFILAQELGIFRTLKTISDSPFIYAGVPPEFQINYYEAAALIGYFASGGMILNMKDGIIIEQNHKMYGVDTIRNWLREIVVSGTASHAHFKGYGLSGKTGTGADFSGQFNGVFIGYLTAFPLGIVVNIKGKLGSNAAMIASDTFFLLLQKGGK